LESRRNYADRIAHCFRLFMLAAYCRKLHRESFAYPRPQCTSKAGRFHFQ
jgi:hypothetical protein